MAKTITEKRAELFNKWELVKYGNNENMYYRTIVLGIPDGDDEETVLYDLKTGFYDSDIDETIAVYDRAINRYEKDGYYADKTVMTREQIESYLKYHEIWKTKIYKSTR